MLKGDVKLELTGGEIRNRTNKQPTTPLCERASPMKPFVDTIYTGVAVYRVLGATTATAVITIINIHSAKQ